MAINKKEIKRRRKSKRSPLNAVNLQDSTLTSTQDVCECTCVCVCEREKDLHLNLTI